MSTRNAVHRGFDGFGKASGAEKKSGGWYWRSDETIAVVDLQKSQFGPQYYVNLAFWIIAVGDEPYPKTWKSHIWLRIGGLPSCDGEAIERMLDLNVALPDEHRAASLQALLVEAVSPVVECGASLVGLREMVDDGTFDAAGIMLPAREHLGLGGV